MRLPSHQVHLSLPLYFSSQAAAEAGKAAEWEKQQCEPEMGLEDIVAINKFVDPALMETPSRGQG